MSAVTAMLVGAAALVVLVFVLMMITNFRHNVRYRHPWNKAADRPPAD